MRALLLAALLALGAVVPLPGKHVEFLTPGHAGLAADLDRAAAAMAPRLGVPWNGPPLQVVVEPDYVSQARQTGEVGEAVPGPGADLFLVDHPDDRPAYRFALARVLLDRSGLAGRLPPWLAEGAALWLSRAWYGRSFEDWLPLLAAGDALPTADQMLAPEMQADASPLLWTPVAAVLVDRLPGQTLAQKLAQVPDRKAVAAGLASLARLSRAERRPPPLAPPRFWKGVSLAMLNRVDAGYHAPALDRQLDVLARLGADAVSLMPFAYQPDPHQPQLKLLRHGPASETDIGLIYATRRARARGFAVLYKPHVWVGRDSWPGEIEMRSEADWTRWFAAYRRYVLHHAILAQWARADAFCVGVELSRTTHRAAEWRQLIAAVRRIYSGRVTYAANWDRDLTEVPFWDRLDAVGVDAYYPLAASPQAGPEELARGARAVVSRLATAARQTGKPLLLTEVGFAAQRGAWIEPHREGGEYSEADQAAAYRALFTALGRPPWLAGAFVWKAFSAETSRSAAGRADFRFLGREAEAAVRSYYGGR